MKKRKIMLLSAAAAALLLSSCGDYVGKEKTHPLYVKAGTAKSAGEYQESARCYEEFLLICPKSAVTHYELGNLYADNLNDPLKAIYHYEKYLEMNPNDTTNAPDIRSFVETSRKNLFKNLCEEYKNDPELQQSNEELKKVQERLQVYVEHCRKQAEVIKRLRDDRITLQDQVKQLLSRQNQPAPRQPAAQPPKTVQVPAAQPAQTTPPPKPAAQPSQPKTAATQPKSKGVTYYKVQKGDSLVKISRKHYGSPKYFRLIANANPGKVSKNLQVQVGQTLVIPALPQR